jgi:hypothetical protein
MVMAAKLTEAQKQKIKFAVRENILDKTANKVGPKANSTRKKVSDKDARNAAKTMNQAIIQRGGKGKAGLRTLTEYIGRTSGGRGASQLTARPGKIKTGKKTLVVTRQKDRMTPADVLEKRAKERNARLSKVFKKVTARGAGTSVAGPKPNSKVQVAKPSPATTRAKVLMPKDAKLDDSRRTAMREANNARTLKDAVEREKEQRPDKNVSRNNVNSKTTPEQREADRRVAEALKAITKAEKAKAKAEAEAKAKLVKAPKRSITSSGGSRGTFTGSSSGKVGITYTK